MAKTISLIISLTSFMFAQNFQYEQLNRDCLQCHEQQSIPSELIYRRYLASYSVPEKMVSAILAYLKNPRQEKSIMPSQFFLKFPMKAKVILKDEILESDIKAFIDYFDIKKRLVLPK